MQESSCQHCTAVFWRLETTGNFAVWQLFWSLMADMLATRILRVIRRILGAPDYGAYLEHCRAAGHLPRLSEREYVRECFEAKGKGVRCC